MSRRIVFWAFLLVVTLFGLSCGSKSGPCKDDYDCDGSEVCNEVSGRCEPFVCREDADCLDPRLRCDNNSCLPR